MISVKKTSTWSKAMQYMVEARKEGEILFQSAIYNHFGVETAEIVFHAVVEATFQDHAVERVDVHLWERAGDGSAWGLIRTRMLSPNHDEFV